EDALGALIDDRALVAAEGSAVLLALEEVLAHLRTDRFQHEPQVRRDRIVAQDRVAGLKEIAQAERGKAAEQRERNRNAVQRPGLQIERADEERGDGEAERQNDESRRERQGESAHPHPPQVLSLRAAQRARKSLTPL